jgi:hypothetical protein
VVIGNATHKWTAIYAFEEHGGEVRYVGKTTRYMIDRRKQHMLPSNLRKSRPICRWLKKRHAGAGFVTRLIEHVKPGEDWAARERHWIAHYREHGHRLLNLTDGGEGAAGRKMTLAQRRKIAAAHMTGETFACHACASSFYRKASAIAKGDNKYCSRACYQAHGNARPKPLSKAFQEAARLATLKRHAEQSHCKRGHPLSGENLFFTSQGSRGCKACRKVHKQAYWERKANG